MSTMLVCDRCKEPLPAGTPAFGTRHNRDRAQKVSGHGTLDFHPAEAYNDLCQYCGHELMRQLAVTYLKENHGYEIKEEADPGPAARTADQPAASRGS